MKLSPLIKKRNKVETVLVARKYKVRAWMLSALEALANQSPKPTMVEELREPFELDWQTIAKILSIQCQLIALAPIPTYLKRPYEYCSSCKMGKLKVTCKFTCRNLGFPNNHLLDDSWGSPSWEDPIDYNVGADKNGTGPMVAGLFEEELKDWT